MPDQRGRTLVLLSHRLRMDMLVSDSASKLMSMSILRLNRERLVVLELCNWLSEEAVSRHGHDRDLARLDHLNHGMSGVS